ncbi:unnamed protein product [Urochloa humidicola]
MAGSLDPAAAGSPDPRAVAAGGPKITRLSVKVPNRYVSFRSLVNPLSSPERPSLSAAPLLFRRRSSQGRRAPAAQEPGPALAPFLRIAAWRLPSIPVQALAFLRADPGIPISLASNSSSSGVQRASIWTWVDFRLHWSDLD